MHHLLTKQRLTCSLPASSKSCTVQHTANTFMNQWCIQYRSDYERQVFHTTSKSWWETNFWRVHPLPSWPMFPPMGTWPLHWEENQLLSKCREPCTVTKTPWRPLTGLPYLKSFLPWQFFMVMPLSEKRTTIQKLGSAISKMNSKMTLEMMFKIICRYLTAARTNMPTLPSRPGTFTHNTRFFKKELSTRCPFGA